MKKSFTSIVIVFLALICFFLSSSCVYAEECTSKELRELRQIANKISFSYKLNETSSDAYFSITAYNMNRQVYLEGSNFVNFSYHNSKEQFLLNYGAGESLTLVARGSAFSACSENKLLTFQIDLPHYNFYYNSEICKPHPDIELCQKWYDSSEYTEEQFIEKVKAYEQSITEPLQKDQTLVDDAVEFLLEYKLYFIALLVVLILIVIIRFVIKKRKSPKIDL